MKKLIFSFLISASCAYASDTVEMPSKEALQARLDKIGMRHFAEKTNIITQLADQKMSSLDVAMTVEISIFDYFKSIEKSMPAPMVRMHQEQMAMHEPLILEALLKDAPAALEELKELGICKPIEQKSRL